MLVQPAIDSISAVMMADSEFDEACDLEPEDAAEIHAAPPADPGTETALRAGPPGRSGCG